MCGTAARFRSAKDRPAVAIGDRDDDRFAGKGGAIQTTEHPGLTPTPPPPTPGARVVRVFTRPLLLRRFMTTREASVAVEFGLAALPFFALAFAILQTATIFFAGQSLETAAANTSRLIQTGQAQTAGWSAAQFKQQVCNQIYAIFDCNNGVYVDVKTYSSFAAVNLNAPVQNGTFDSSQLGYNPGGPGAIVVVRLYYQYPVYVSLLALSNLTGGFNLLAATAVFKNESYSSS
jgi:Flp pilus assembly protein TadG